MKFSSKRHAGMNAPFRHSGASSSFVPMFTVTTRVALSSSPIASSARASCPFSSSDVEDSPPTPMFRNVGTARPWPARSHSANRGA